MAATATKNTAKGPAKADEAKAEESSSVYKGSDEFEKMMIDKTSEIISEYSETVTKLASADGDREKAVKTFIESSDHPEAIAIRETIKAANERLNQLAEENVVSLTLSDEEKDKLKTLSSVLREKAKSAIVTLEGTAALMSVDGEPLVKAIEALKTRMPAQTRGRKPGDAGSSLPRARVNLSVTGGNFTDHHFESFSKLAITLNCDAGDLQKAYAAEAGVDHMDIKSVKKPVTFKFQPNSNGAEYMILVTPKETAKTGPKPAETQSEEKTDASAA